MAQPETTCWTVIQGAAAGNRMDREQFAHRYAPVIAAYLSARWRGAPRRFEVDDAVQEVFVECFRRHGVLETADRDRPGGFRPFLYGVVRNIALRFEARWDRAVKAAPEDALDNMAGDETSLSRVFDRAWALALVKEAAQRQAEHARQVGEAAVQRVELLRLRFQEGLPIRAIAGRWQADPAVLHHEYAQARREFKAALLEVVAFHHPGPEVDLEQECANLLASLG
jgi:RNA polymerase sigma-70 factor (ECF subfamily)